MRMAISCNLALNSLSVTWLKLNGREASHFTTVCQNSSPGGKTNSVGGYANGCEKSSGLSTTNTLYSLPTINSSIRAAPYSLHTRSTCISTSSNESQRD